MITVLITIYPRAPRRTPVFQTFAENPFLYLGMIVNAIVYVRLRWCVLSEVDVAIT